VLVAVAGVLGVVWVGFRSYQQFCYLRWQDKCLNYTPPANQIIYEEDEAGAKLLLTRSAGYRTVSKKSDVVGYAPPFLAEGSAAFPYAFIDEIETIGDIRALAFMHRRRSPNGKLERLIVVPVEVYLPERNIFTSPRAVDHGVAYELASMRFGSRLRPATMAQDRLVYSDISMLRFYAGQPDPSDESRFSIRYDVRLTEDDVVKSGEIKGQFCDDGSVEYHVYGPLAGKD
jgi:hypothetical protein